ncbi:hypothetical protein [Myxococcus faecalis]|uniref:hypothetical protein n=1 Tax=Myxococcus faecalis TaxID=3115646 RepID=UPI003CF4D944
MVMDVKLHKAQAVLVVESPHEEEVVTGVPLSGKAGIVVGKALINRGEPIGPLCQKGEVRLSIVNTFLQPRQFDVEGEGRSRLLSDIDSLRYGDPCGYKREIFELLNCTRERGLVESYKERLVDVLAVAEGRKIIVCGLIAQAVFEWVFGVEGLRPMPIS